MGESGTGSEDVGERALPASLERHYQVLLETESEEAFRAAAIALFDELDASDYAQELADALPAALFRGVSGPGSLFICLRMCELARGESLAIYPLLVAQHYLGSRDEEDSDVLRSTREFSADAMMKVSSPLSEDCGPHILQALEGELASDAPNIGYLRQCICLLGSSGHPEARDALQALAPEHGAAVEAALRNFGSAIPSKIKEEADGGNTSHGGEVDVPPELAEKLKAIQYSEAPKKAGLIWALRGCVPEANVGAVLDGIRQYMDASAFPLSYASTIVAGELGDGSPQTAEALLRLLDQQHILDGIKESSIANLTSVGLVDDHTEAQLELANTMAQIPGMQEDPSVAQAAVTRMIEHAVIQTLRTLGDVRTEQSVQVLVSVLEGSSDSDVRDQCILSLGALGDPSTRERLEFLAQSSSIAATALEHFGTRAPAPAPKKTKPARASASKKSGCLSALLVGCAVAVTVVISLL